MRLAVGFRLATVMMVGVPLLMVAAATIWVWRAELARQADLDAGR